VSNKDDTPEVAIAVVDGSHPEPLNSMVRKLFENQPVEVTDGGVEFDDDSLVLLRDGEVVAASPIEALSETVLLVNSDLYTTGAVGLEETRLPDVIAELSGTAFDVRGYPESSYEKVPLILISRHIELLSYRNGGTHRASFQMLSRIDRESGTMEVYDRLGSSEADTHVYGVPDRIPPQELGLKIHAGYGTDYTSTWFVVHNSDGESAALVAIETAPNEWRGRWTFDSEEVDEIEEKIIEHY
jgi:hypothetical protein